MYSSTGTSRWWHGLKRVPRSDLDQLIQRAFLLTCAGTISQEVKAHEQEVKAHEQEVKAHEQEVKAHEQELNFLRTNIISQSTSYY